MASADLSGTRDARRLPSYLDETGGEPAPADYAIGEGERHHLVPEAVHEGWVAIGRAAHHLSDRLAAPSSASSPPAGLEALRGVVIHISRHLVMAPADAARAFDRSLPRLSEPITTRRGTLVLSPTATGRGRRDPSQLRAVAGRLHLWLSPVPLPVELDLVPWGDWRTMVTLHPDRRLGWTVGPHRRSRYFAAGHAAMDVVIAQLRSRSGHDVSGHDVSGHHVSGHDVSADDGDGPYDAAPCGRSWSTPIPAQTA